MMWWMATSLVVVGCAALLGGSATASVPFVELPFFTTRDMGSPFIQIDVPNSSFTGLVVLDTGSPLLWLPTRTRPTVTGASPAQPCPGGFAPGGNSVSLGRTTSFGYGSGYMVGPDYTVTVELPGLASAVTTLTNTSVSAATTVDLLACYAGILGVDQGSLTAPLIFAQHGLLSVFSVGLSCAARRGELLRVGVVRFGDDDAGAVVGGASGMQTVPLLPVSASRLRPLVETPQGVVPNFTEWWQFGVTSISVGDSVVDQRAGLQGIVDTGTSIIAVGPHNAFVSRLQVAPDCSNFSALQPFSIVLDGGATATLQPEDYVVRDSSVVCRSVVSIVDNLPSKFIVLGVPFFWKHFVVFDYTASEVRFGTKVVSGKCAELNPSATGNHGGHPNQKLDASAEVGVVLGVVVVLLVVGLLGCFIFHERRAIVFMVFEEPLDSTQSIGDTTTTSRDPIAKYSTVTSLGSTPSGS
jgi:hypothetical protein